MTESDRQSIKRSISAWQRASPVLDQVRREDIRSADTVKSIAAFQGMASAKVQSHAPVPTSGLIEQQRLFAILKQGK